MLSAYLARIGHADATPPTWATLAALHRAHVAAIPFENTEVMEGRTPSLALDDIVAKLVESRRGGYCFEQNTLFAAVLAALGLPVSLLMARVRFDRAEIRPRTHCLLRVEVDGHSCIADVGFGAWGLAAPLRLDAGVERHDGLLAHRLMKTGEVWTLQARLDDAWRDLYAFTLEAHYPVDLEMANHYTATHPDSLFRRQLVVQRILAGRRLMLVGDRLTMMDMAGRHDRTLTPSQLARVLQADFGLQAKPHNPIVSLDGPPPPH